MTQAGKDRVVEASIKFVEAHKAWAETLPHRRKSCQAYMTEAFQTCYSEAWQEALNYPADDMELETDGWCDNCRHNMEMALQRARRAAKRNGALRRLVSAVGRRNQ
jgi:hypothetical protein